MPTIFDVAEIAGVSAKTVSRVLNGDSAVKRQTKERVLAAMSELGYKVNSQARQLRTGRTNSPIGMLQTDPASGYQSRFHHAMLTASMEADNYLAIELFELERSESLNTLDKFLSRSSIRSMVLLPPLCDYGPLKTMLRERDIKGVLISPMTPDLVFPSVSLDDRQAARDATEYLLSIGHTRIAHIAGHPDHAAAFLRKQGFYEAFAAKGLPRPPSYYVSEGAFTFKSGILASEKLLTLVDRPTAIFVSNDEMAAATCSVAHKMNLRIPEDLSVVGFDDAPIASAIWPTLTTVQQPYLEMARKCVAIANGQAGHAGEHDTATGHILPHSLIIRDSTSALK